MAQSKPEGTLKRCFGLRECITITVGTVIGVGLFTVGANVVGMLGPGVILATFAAMAISIYPSLLYAEMGGALPFAGGTYQYASLGLGRIFGMLAGWNFIISMVSVASGEALAFSFYFRTLLNALGITLPFGDSVIACAVILAFLILGIRGVEMSGKLQNGFLFFFWGVAVVWGCSMIPSLRFENFQNPPQLSAAGFLPCVALIWWCFAGFETCCALGEEIRHPQINLPRALFLAPFIVFAVNGLFQWVLVCIVPADSLSILAEASAPYAEGMRLAGTVGFPLILLCAGIAFGGDFSTLNASICAPARYLFTMARDGSLPSFFSRVHPKLHTPYTAICTLGGLMILLVGTNSISFIASLSLFATLLYYVIGIASACGLRKKHPALPRPYKAPFIRAAAPISILIYLVMITQLERGAVLSGVLWSALGLGIYWLCSRKRSGKDSDPLPLPTDNPPSEPEKRKMDREYHVWCFAAAAAVFLVIGLYAFSWLN